MNISSPSCGREQVCAMENKNVSLGTKHIVSFWDLQPFTDAELELCLDETDDDQTHQAEVISESGYYHLMLKCSQI